MQRSVKFALVAVVVVIIGGAFGFWYFVLRDTAAPEASLEALQQDADENGGTGSTVGSEVENPDGTWTLVSGDNIFVGYRIEELFGGETVKKTATGRTPAVTGTLTVQGNQITAVEITADMQQLKSDESRRDNSQKGGGLETDSFPTATFTLTEPITLPSTPTEGTSADVEATGDLTLHGVTKQITISLQTSLDNGRIIVAGSAPIVLADYEIDPPSSGFVDVDENGTLEVQLAFVKA
jgi:polyisoprenoid-binding protein YceI